MMIASDEMIESLSDYLFAADPGREEMNVFAVLDGAAIPNLLSSLYQHEPEYLCLYRGELKPDLAEVAPYLVRLEPGSEFATWVMAKGWGNHWGIFLTTQADIRALRRHLRKFLIVYNPEHKPVYFRYYDPRVLRLYLPTCNAEELATVFGPVESYLLEDENPQTVLRLRNVSGSLKQESLPLAPNP
jgi:hypothetical protein